jgi:hypothetical protein
MGNILICLLVRVGNTAEEPERVSQMNTKCIQLNKECIHFPGMQFSIALTKLSGGCFSILFICLSGH